MDKPKYKSINKFMNGEFEDIKTELLSLTNPKCLGIIKELNECKNKNDLTFPLREHFSEYAEKLFGITTVAPHTGYSMGLCPVREMYGLRKGYMNIDFTIRIPPIYVAVQPFNKKFMAVVEDEGKLGLMNDSGLWEIEPIYQEILVDEDCLKYICNDGMDIYCYTLGLLQEFIMGEPEELTRFSLSK